jgi:hypothetical protein
MHRVGDLRYTYLGSRSIRSQHKLSRKCRLRLRRNSSRDRRVAPLKDTHRLGHQLQRLQPAVHHHLVEAMTDRHLTMAELTEMSGLLMTPNGLRTRRNRELYSKESEESSSPPPAAGPRQHHLHVR